MLGPGRASAFWYFSTNVDAAINTAIPSIPSSSTPILEAVINSNPNSSVPIALDISGDSALVSHNGPVGTIADIENTPPTDRISVYVVRSGDTLSEISDMFGISVNTIIWANDLKGTGDVHPDDTLIILPISGVKWTVVEGDTLKSLAKKYNGDANEIAQFNGLDSSAPLEIGSTIIIPGGEIAAPVVPAVTTSSQYTPPLLSGGGSFSAGYYGNPVPGAILTQGVHDHNAVDLSYSGGARGMPIHAAATGKVTSVSENGSYNQGWGNDVVINHTDGTQTLYAHMSSVAATVGQNVLGGDIIGFIGSTGKSFGAHLHFEVRGAANPFRNCRVGSVCSPQ
jgi:LysM repeat protein